MMLQFELTIPNNNSWNGIDTGNKGGYFIHVNVDKKKADELNGKEFYYTFVDGWRANIKVSKHKKQKSNGFRGYNWMVDEIIKYGKIFEVHNRRARNLFEKELKEKMTAFINSDEYVKTHPQFLTENVAMIIAELHYKKGIGV